MKILMGNIFFYLKKVKRILLSVSLLFNNNNWNFTTTFIFIIWSAYRNSCLVIVLNFVYCFQTERKKRYCCDIRWMQTKCIYNVDMLCILFIHSKFTVLVLLNSKSPILYLNANSWRSVSISGIEMKKKHSTVIQIGFRIFIDYILYTYNQGIKLKHSILI